MPPDGRFRRIPAAGRIRLTHRLGQLLPGNGLSSLRIHFSRKEGR